jgi:adenine phosphoribosyltransferase
MSIKDKIRTIPDFPQKGIMFRDITTLLKDAEGFKEVVDALYERYKDIPINTVAGIEARGFILGAALAYALGLGFVPVRKKGKLPGETETYEYELEYGTDSIEVHRDAITSGDNILLVDDLLATGGTCLAAAKLIEKLGGCIHEVAFIVDLPDVGGRQRLHDAGYEYFYLCEFEGD